MRRTLRSKQTMQHIVVRSGQRHRRARIARARALTRRPRAWRGLRETRSAPHNDAPRAVPAQSRALHAKTKDTDSAARDTGEDSNPRRAQLAQVSGAHVCTPARAAESKTRAQSATRVGRSGVRARKSPRQPPPQARPLTRLLAKSSTVVHALDTHGHAQPYPLRVLIHALHGRSPRSS